MATHNTTQADRQRFGLLVRTERRRQKLTQAKLAERLGISVSFLGHIERATRIPSMETVVAVARALCFSLDGVFEIQPDHSVTLSQETLAELLTALETARSVLTDQKNPSSGA